MCHRQPGGGKSEMKTYTIDTDNSITAFATKQEAGEGETFSSQPELASLVAEWPADRLIEVLERHPRTRSGKEVHGPEVGGQPDLESDPEPGRRQPGGNAHEGPEGGHQGQGSGKAGQEGEEREEAPGQGCQGETRQGWQQARRSARRQQEGHGPGPAPT